MTPIRVLATAYDYRPRLGGVATCAFELLTALSRQPGVELRLIAKAGPDDLAFDRASKIPTRRVRLPGEAVLGIPVLMSEISRELLTWKPDCVLNFLWLPCGAATWAASSFQKVPYFVFAHGVELLESNRTWKKRARRLAAPMKRSVLRNAASVLAVSQFTRDVVAQECGIARERIEVVYNGVDPESFFPAGPAADLLARHGLEGKRAFVTISRFDDYKGIDRAIGAFSRVAKLHPDARYLVCGDGPDRARLEGLVRSRGLEGRVIFAGSVPHDRLRDYYNLAHAFVLVSRDDFAAPNFEGFGIVFLEAAACGKASIAGRSGGIGDAVVDGKTGWLVDPNDEEAIAAAMIESLENLAKTSALGEAGLARARGELTWDRMAERVLACMRAKTAKGTA